MNKVLMLALPVLLLSSFLAMDSVYAQSGNDEDQMVQFVIRIGIGVGMGALISVVTKLAGEEPWNNKKVGYSIVVAIFSAFVVIDAFKEPITFANAISLLLQITGGAFFANTGIKMGAKIQAASKKPK